MSQEKRIMLEDIIQKYGLVEYELDYHAYNDYAPQEKWKHHIIQHPEVLRDYISECGIIGSTIKDIMLRYGHIFHLGNLHKIEGYEELRSISDSNHSIVLGIEIDTPITLVTDKGVFEFEFAEDSTVNFSIKGAEEKVERRPLDSYDDFEFDITKIFKDIIGKKIVGFEIQNEKPEEAYLNRTGAFGFSVSDKQDAYVKSFSLKLDNGYALSVNPFIDFCELYLIDPDGNNIVISSAKVKDMIVTK